MGSAKAALVLLVEILSAALSGANFGLKQRVFGRRGLAGCGSNIDLY